MNARETRERRAAIGTVAPVESPLGAYVGGDGGVYLTTASGWIRHRMSPAAARVLATELESMASEAERRQA